jgi:hypothetical protein
MIRIGIGTPMSQASPYFMGRSLLVTFKFQSREPDRRDAI